MPTEGRSTRSFILRAFLIGGLLAIVYPVFKAQPKEQTLLLDLGDRADAIRSLRIEWAQTENLDLRGTVQRNFTRSPCPEPGSRPCLLTEHLNVPDGTYTLLTEISYERASGASNATEREEKTHDAVAFGGGSTKIFLSR
jgi:hypothetical protein